MSSVALPLLVAIPLLVAGSLMILGTNTRIHKAALIGVLTSSMLAGAALVFRLSDGSALGHGVGSWPVGIAIPFAADMFTALMLTVTGLLSLTCAWFAIAAGSAESRYFAPLLLVLVAGVNGALMTADLFNLFVFIEVMLLPSYGLFVLASRGNARFNQVAGARLYVTVNLLTSTVFLIGVGFLYGTAGTVNIGELAGLASDSGPVAVAGAICLLALGIKAAVVPVHGWLARAYPATSPAITALFSGLHTKVAIYAIYRIYAVLFDGDSRWLWIGMVIFCLTMVIGVLGAVGETTMRSILAFHMVSQIGYILLGVALFTEAGLSAGIFYLLHHMIVKASLFLSTGAIEHCYGSGRIGDVSNVARAEPVIAVAFFIAALSLAGIPPFSGFVAKLALILAALSAAQVAAVVVMILVSLVTLLSMLKIWAGVFWGVPTKINEDDQSSRGPNQVRTSQSSQGLSDPSSSADATSGAPLSLVMNTSVVTASGPTTPLEDASGSTIPTRRINPALAAPAVILALVTVGLGLGSEFLLSLSQTAADGLLNPDTYLEAVTHP